MPHNRLNTRKHNSRRGFSLLEVIVTIVVLGLLASIAFVGYGAVVTRAATSSTEASLMHIDRAVSVTHVMRTAAEPGIRIDEDFATAAYGTDMDSSEGSEISSSTGTWDLTRATADMTNGFDPSTVYYSISPTGITGMAKTVIDSSSNGDRWHLSFLKSSPVETITWSAWCDINPADLVSTVSMNPNFTTWPVEGCHYEGSFQAGENPFPVTEVEGQSITPGEGSVSVALPSSFEGIADQVRVTVLAHDSAGDSASPVGEAISKVILAPAAGEPTVVEFNSVDGVVPGLWYSASIDYITAGQVDNSYAVTEPASVQPWTLPAVLNPGLAVDNNLESVSVSTPDLVFDPSITATVAIPTSDSVESGFREITSATLHYREVGADNWSSESVDLTTGSATVSFSSADQGKTFEFAVSFVNSGSSASDLSALEVEVLPEASLGSLPADVDLTASHNPVRGDLDSQKVAWSWSGGTGSFAHAFSPDTDAPVSGTSATTTGLGETHMATVTSCNDWGCSTASLSQEVGDVEDKPAAPTAPEFKGEVKEPNPDVSFAADADTADEQFQVQRTGETGTYSGEHTFVDVGQRTEVCAAQQTRTGNAYGWSPWSDFSDETCHTTGGINDITIVTTPEITTELEADSTPRVKFNWVNPGTWEFMEVSTDGGASWTPVSPSTTTSGWISASFFTTPTYKVRVKSRAATNEYGLGALSGWATSTNASQYVGGPPQSCAAPGTITVSSQEEQDLTPRVYFSWTDRNPTGKQQYSTNGGSSWTNTSIHSTNSGWITASHGTNYTWKVRAYNTCSNSYGSKNSNWRESNNKSEWVGRPVATPGKPASISLWSAESPSATPHVRWDWTDRNPTHQQIYKSWCNCWGDYNNTWTGYGWEQHAHNQTLGFRVRNRYGAQGNNYNRANPWGSAPYLWGDWRYSNYDTETTGGVPNVSMWRQSSIHGLTGGYHQATLYVDWGTTDHSGGKRAPTYDSWQLLNTSGQVVASGTSSVGGSGSWAYATPNTQYLARVQSCNSYGCSGWKSEWWTYTQPRTPKQTKREPFDWPGLGNCDSVTYSSPWGSIGSHNVHLHNWFWGDFTGSQTDIEGSGMATIAGGTKVHAFVHNYGNEGKTTMCNTSFGQSFLVTLDVSMAGIYSQSDQGRFYLGR